MKHYLVTFAEGKLQLRLKYVRLIVNCFNVLIIMFLKYLFFGMENVLRNSVFKDTDASKLEFIFKHQHKR